MNRKRVGRKLSAVLVAGLVALSVAGAALAHVPSNTRVRAWVTKVERLDDWLRVRGKLRLRNNRDQAITVDCTLRLTTESGRTKRVDDIHLRVPAHEAETMGWRTRIYEPDHQSSLETLEVLHCHLV